MDNIKNYTYSEQQRSFIETFVIPFAFFRTENAKVKTVLISDGLCELLHENRENALTLLEGDIYDSVHSEDVYELRRKCKNFFFGNGEVNLSARVKFRTETEYHYIHLNGKKILSDTNETIYVLWYNNIDIKTCSPEYEEQKRLFGDFLHGESNDIPFHVFGYKGYTVWNMTDNELVYNSGVGIADAILGNKFTYSDYYYLHKGWLTEKEDIAFFDRISPENITVAADFGEHTFTFSSSDGQVSIKIAASSMMSPDGELYLKLQAENVTDSIVYDTMIKSSAMVSDFMAYVDVNSENVYFIEGENKIKVPFGQMLAIFSVNLGYRFKSVAQLMNFIETKCSENQSATVINRFSADCVKSIRLQKLGENERKYFICCSDVTELMKHEVNSSMDDLTGLPNMTQFRILAQTYITKLRSQNKTPVLIYFDIRDMKAINEKHGFERGNSVLIHTMLILKAVFSGGELVSRLAEDHFVVLTGKRSMEQRIEKVYEQVMNNPMNIPVRICAGIYEDNGQDIDIDSLCDRARLACRSIKDDYNKKYKLFDNKMFEEYHKRRYILTHFEEALENGYIKVHYQPIVRSLTGNICDMEALCRWIRPDRGMAQPLQFIPVLEEHRLIHKLDFYMVRKICEDLDKLRNMNFPLVPISINLSRIDFEMFDVADEVIKIIDSYRIPHKLFSIEITESAFIHNADFLNGQINKFRSSGFEVWMDDFGSDYSSFKTLQKYNFDVVKLDMEFMRNFSKTGKNAIILTEVVNMLTKLGIHTLAEGVDTDEKMKFLRDIGCEKMQGHSFNRAMPLDYYISQYNRKIGRDYDDFTTANYYNQIGSIRLDGSILAKNRIKLSDSSLSLPVAVIEYRKDNFRILKANDEYKRFVEKIGLGEQCENNDYHFWKKQPSKEFRLAAKKCLVTYTNQAIFDDIEGNYLVSARFICISYKYSLDMGAFAVVVEKYRKIGDKK